MAKKLKQQFEDNRILILQAAIRLFAKQGVLGTSFSDIAKEVKLSKGTVSYYFPSKEHLVYEVSEYNLNEVTSLLFQWIDALRPDEPPKEAARQLMEVLKSRSTCLALEMSLFSEAYAGNDGMQKRIIDKIAEWATMVKIGLMKIGTSREAIEGQVTLLMTLMESLMLRSPLGLPMHDTDLIYGLLEEE